NAEKMILRLAVYEIPFAVEKVPAGVAVNEAVELAKIYGDDAASKFVNGVLGKIVRAAGQ
ncbi:MAG: N utilization substance protein B, partial [Acidaminococcaceae bacterium]|nr:N utilization substance protein B [Acidaminococcaceae bacterium]